NLDLFLLVITDIIDSNSQAITLGTATALVEKAFAVTLENNTALLPGVVSRKKQIVPVLQNS
ncbi:MAG: DHHA2 domain-containing protein, partial [Culicoidibacterales bacterium]